MIPGEILKAIGSIVGPDHLITAQAQMEAFSVDATKLSASPDAVVFPGSSEEVSRILRMATEKGFPVIPRGAGSGMSGGAVPTRGGLVLAMNRFDRILSIDQDNLIARVEPGVITSHLQEAVEKRGLFYPPDPASAAISTIGGNVAECAGGLRAVKYGVTRDYVLGLTVVLPTGEIIKTGVETVKGVAGYDLTRLIVGSEGTLAVITAITLRLVPRPPTRKTMLAFFPNVASAVGAVSAMIREGVTPTILELLDRRSLECVREEMALTTPGNAGAMLLMEVDGDEGLAAREARRVESVCRAGRVLAFHVAESHEEVERLWEARRNVSPSLYKLGPHKVSEDIVVPRSRMAEFVDYLRELEERYHLPLPAFGHAGDGNIHVNIMLDQERPDERESAREIVRAVFEKVLEMGGTLTGEHGIGITKAPYLEMEIPRPGLELMSRIKRAFDPRGILNPGKIFAQET